jgi:hypothetical protein
VDGQDVFGRFDLYDDQSGRNDVDPVIPVKHQQCRLPLIENFACLMPICQALLVSQLQQSRTEEGMNGKSGIDDLAGKQIVLQREFRHLGAFASWR